MGSYKVSNNPLLRLTNSLVSIVRGAHGLILIINDRLQNSRENGAKSIKLTKLQKNRADSQFWSKWKLSELSKKSDQWLKRVEGGLQRH